MERSRFFFLMIHDYLDSSWRSKPWSVRSVYHFRWMIVGLFSLIRGLLYSIRLHLYPSSVANEPIYLIFNYIGIISPIYYSLLIEVTFCTIVQYHLSSTFDKPLQFWKVVNKIIYRLEELYLENFNVLRPVNSKSNKIKRWMNSYRDEEIMWKTSRDYHRSNHGKAHWFSVHISICEIMLKKINQIELAYFFQSFCLGKYNKLIIKYLF